MKKLAILILVVVLVVVFSMMACNGNSDSDISKEVPIEQSNDTTEASKGIEGAPIEPNDIAEASKGINMGISIEPNDTTEAGPCDYDYKDIITVRNEAGYRKQYVLRLSEEPEVLAEFLYATSELDEFVEVDAEDHSKTIEHAVEVFSRDEDIHQQALEKAKEVFANMRIECNWEEVRKIDPVGVEEEYEAYYVGQNTPAPLVTDSGTGKPISNEPAGPWNGPTTD